LASSSTTFQHWKLYAHAFNEALCSELGNYLRQYPIACMTPNGENMVMGEWAYQLLIKRVSKLRLFIDQRDPRHLQGGFHPNQPKMFSKRSLQRSTRVYLLCRANDPRLFREGDFQFALHATKEHPTDTSPYNSSNLKRTPPLTLCFALRFV
jgi:hypothetical protein